MTTDTPQPIDRRAARVLLLDADDRVLLFRCRSGDGDGRHFWITPGGGLEDGETHEQAALRELREEVGLEGIPLGPHVWTRTHTFPWLGKLLRQTEQFYLCRLDRPIEVKRHLNSQEELMYLVGHRWWSAEEIDAETVEQFAPRRLAALLRELVTEGSPCAAVDVGV